MRCAGQPDRCDAARVGRNPRRALNHLALTLSRVAAAAACLSACGCDDGEGASLTQPPAADAADTPEDALLVATTRTAATFEAATPGSLIVEEFRLANTSSHAVMVSIVSTSCGCTSATIGLVQAAGSGPGSGTPGEQSTSAVVVPGGGEGSVTMAYLVSDTKASDAVSVLIGAAQFDAADVSDGTLIDAELPTDAISPTQRVSLHLSGTIRRQYFVQPKEALLSEAERTASIDVIAAPGAELNLAYDEALLAVEAEPVGPAGPEGEALGGADGGEGPPRWAVRVTALGDLAFLTTLEITLSLPAAQGQAGDAGRREQKVVVPVDFEP